MRFLTVEDVLELHALQLERFGGGAGIRSLPLLESAVAQPEASFGGAYLHADVFEMAAAYLFHIVQNHPFVDGNKRAGLLAALVFLDLNGHSLATADDRLYELTINVAAAGGRPRGRSRVSPPCSSGPVTSRRGGGNSALRRPEPDSRGPNEAGEPSYPFGLMVMTGP